MNSWHANSFLYWHKKIEIDDESQLTISSTDNKLEDKIEQSQNSLLVLTLPKKNLWCTNCQNERHTMETCKYAEYFDQYF